MAGTQFARRVERILTRAGQQFGSGQLRGTLVRVVSRSGPSNAPTSEQTQDYPFVGLWSDFSAEERASGLIEDNESVLLLGATTLTTTPRAGDKVTVGSAAYQVKSVSTTRPGGTELLHRLIVRA